MTYRLRLVGCLAMVLLLGGWRSTSAWGVNFTNFSEYGTTVNGYQDYFFPGALNPSWLEYDGGGDDGTLFQLNANGGLNMLPAGSDPNKLLYNAVYDINDQEVLALIRVTQGPAGNTGGLFRGGVGAAANTGNGQGANLLFKEPGHAVGGTDNHFDLLNDAIAWGPGTNEPLGSPGWNINQWKWLRIRYEDNGASDTVRGKIWDADGVTPEPGAFQLNWTPGNLDRAGLAGLVTNSINSVAGTFEVDYVLIKAAGLGAIQAGGLTVAPATTTNSPASETFFSANVQSGGTLNITANGINIGNATGATAQSINNGGLFTLNGTVNATTFNNNAGGLLTGTGTLNAALNINAGSVVTTGAAPGTLNVGSTTLGSDGTFVMQISDFSGTAGADPGWSLLNVNGSVNVTSTEADPFVIDLVSLLGNAPGDAANFDGDDDFSLPFLIASGSISGFDPSNFVVDASGFTNDLKLGSFSVEQVGNSLVLQFTAIPEPASALLWVALGSMALLFAAARRRR